MLKKNYYGVLIKAINKKKLFNLSLFIKNFPKTNLIKRFSKININDKFRKFNNKFINKKFLKIRFNNKISLLLFTEKLKKLSSLIITFINLIKESLKSFNIKEFFYKFKGIFERLFYSCLIFFIPFCFIANQAFFPQVVYRNELLTISSVAFELFSRFDILKSIILKFAVLTSGWATNPVILFFALIFYLRVFAFSYDKFRMPLSIAFQGSTGFVYISLSYMFALFNSLLSAPFTTYIFFKAVIFRQFLEKNFAILDEWFDDNYYELTEEFVEKFSERIYDKYEIYLIFLVKNVLGILSFMTLCSLIYNIFYYVLKNKNPKIFYVTHAANSILKKREKNKK